jgi:hypothetical protein|eukprot:Stramenopile-MAST_4_protein_2437
MNLIEKLKRGVQLLWTGVFCYSTMSLLALGTLNLYSECDKPLAVVLVGFGLLFLFGLVLEIAGMQRPKEGPMPLPIAAGKVFIFLPGCLLWTMLANIWSFSSVHCSDSVRWNGVGLYHGALGITVWMNIFCLIVLLFLGFIVLGKCPMLVGYAYNEKARPVYLPYLPSYDAVSVYLHCHRPAPGAGHGDDSGARASRRFTGADKARGASEEEESLLADAGFSPTLPSPSTMRVDY